MVPSRSQKGRLGKFSRHYLESSDHQFETFVGSPLAECEDSMLRIAALREIWILRPLRQNAVGAHMYIFAAIFFGEDLPVSWHQHRDRIRQEKNLGRNDTRNPVGTRMTNPDILQVNGVHQVMQRDMRVPAAQACEHRSKKPYESSN